MNVKSFFKFCAFSFFLLMADFALKRYVHNHIPPLAFSSPIYPFGGIEVFQNWHGITFSIVHVMNKGAAWGIFASLQDYLLYVRIAIIGGLITYLFFVPSSNYRKFCLLFIITGALGNVIDYFVYGHVVDMFYCIFWGYSYPVFNIADSAIFIGIALMLAESCVSKIKSSRHAARRST